MELEIKHKYFEQIKSGKKDIEIRDAHITFISEETGESITKKVWSAGVGKKQAVLMFADILTEEEAKELFTDENLMYFVLE